MLFGLSKGKYFIYKVLDFMYFVHIFSILKTNSYISIYKRKN